VHQSLKSGLTGKRGEMRLRRGRNTSLQTSAEAFSPFPPHVFMEETTFLKGESFQLDPTLLFREGGGFLLRYLLTVRKTQATC